MTTVAPAPEAAPASPSRAVAKKPSRFQHHPALDGIRGFALLAVLVYHSDVWLFPGTFVSIDLFFVLSGYLITSLLLVERGATGGIGFKRFWSRRARRLIPGLLAGVFLAMVYTAFAADPVQFPDIRGDAIASLTYVANWWFIFAGQSYFEQFNDPSPLRHMWTLAIEEQFYILWPLLLTGLLVFTRGRTRGVWPLLGVAAVVSAAWMAFLYDPAVDPSRLYFGTDTRAQALLLGAALAFLLYRRPTLGPRAHLAVQTGGYVGVGVLLALFLTVHSTDGFMYRGGFFLAAVASAALIAACVQPGNTPLKYGFSLRPLILAGIASYGLYLYHWPIWVWLSPERTGMEGLPLFVLRFSITVALTWVSYHFLEMPIRAGHLRTRQVPVAAAVGVLGVVAVVLLATAGGGPPTVNQEFAAGTTQVMVVGDSVAAALGENYPPEYVERSGISVVAKGFRGCGIMEGQAVRDDDPPMPGNCDQWATQWKNAVTELQPDISLVLIGGWENVDRIVDGQRYVVGTPEWEAYFRQQLDTATATLQQASGKVVFLTTPCYQPKRTDGRASAYTPERHQAVNATLTSWAATRPDVTVLDLASFVCPTGIYEPTLQGVTLHSDGVHYTAESAPLVWDWLLPQLSALTAGGTGAPATGGGTPPGQATAPGGQVPTTSATG